MRAGPSPLTTLGFLWGHIGHEEMDWGRLRWGYVEECYREGVLGHTGLTQMALCED